jgi:hypothetical protein
MQKKLPLILILALVVLAAWYYLRSTNETSLEEEQAPAEVMREVEQAETPEDAGELVIEEIDEEFSVSGETDFNVGDLSDEALGL